MKNNTLILALLIINISCFVRGFESEDYSCGLYCISGIITSFGTVLTICTCCFCCASILLIFNRLCGNNAITGICIRSQGDDIEIGTQYNHMAADPAADEPVLSYDEAVNMDSLPPVIPGYTYNPNIVNTINCPILPTGEEHPTNTNDAITQETVFCIEMYANLPFPPSYMDTRANNATS